MRILSDLVDLFLPRMCCMCGQRLGANERYICTHCFMNLPFTDYHKVEHSVLEKQFWGHFPIEKAVSMFHHDGEKTRHILYHIKYWGHPELATHLASIYAKELQQHHFFYNIDILIPLPLHWKRQWKRQYNQSHYIAQSISKQTGIPVDKKVVKRVRNNPSQTRLNANQRGENVENIFQLKHPEKIEGKHLLLIDDVTTTGATIISCAKELAKAPHVKISVLTLAIASHTAIPATEGDNIDVSVFGVPLME